MWPIGQAVKTSPSHGGNPGSIPGWVTKELFSKSSGIFFPEDFIYISTVASYMSNPFKLVLP